MNNHRSSTSAHRGKEKETSSRNKMLPTLFDRLTDLDPKQIAEVQKSRGISQRVLKKTVLRDLQWLFNCNNNESLLGLADFPEVKRSTLNYGITPLAGKRMSEIEWSDIEKNLTQAILDFEPRIIPEYLVLECVSNKDYLDLHNVLTIKIEGFLWCSPNPLAFCFRSDIDLENGYFDLKDIG